jgi:HEAT repeat protein
MAARSIDEQMHALEALKSAGATDLTIAELREAFANKSNFLVAKAAAIAAALNVTLLLRDVMSDAFKRFIGGNDKGCAASTAIVKALAAAEVEDEEVYLKGAVHVQMEPTWGGSIDVAVELRCESVAALVRMNSKKMWEPLVKLLADKDPQARSTAGRALGATGQDAAKYLLQYKILIGDKEPTVLGDCFAGHCLLTRSIEVVKPFLRDPNEAIAEAAALALGESRLPAAFEALKEELPRTTRDLRQTVLLAIAMTRHPQAVDLLIQEMTEAPLKAGDILKALAMYRSDSAVRERVRAAAQDSQALTRSFEEHFGRD